MYAIRNEETGHEKSFETKEEVTAFLNSEANPTIYSGWEALGIVINTTQHLVQELQAQEEAELPVELATDPEVTQGPAE